MNEAPKKIWYSFEYEKRIIAGANEEDTPYIRADLVDALVEALEGMTKYLGRDHAGKDLPDLYNKAIYALKAMEEA